MTHDNAINQSLLSFDIGLKRTGVASGQTLTNTAQPAGLLMVKNGRFDWPELDKLIALWRPDKIIIGNPKTQDPHLNKAINRFKSHIQQNHKLPIIDVDETLSSNEANNQLSHTGLSIARKTALRDQLAACLILESYLANTP